MDFHLTIDFFDDMYLAERDWDEDSLRRLVQMAAEHGIRAIHWIGHGRLDDGMWDAGSYLDHDGQAQRLRQKVARVRPIIVDESHRLGLKVWDVMKPSDMVFGLPYASTPLGKGRRPPLGLPQVGAEGTAAIHWLRQHPEYRSRIHPNLDVLPGEEKAKLKTIRLWHEGPELPEPPALEIFTSTDNGVYKPLGRTVPVKRYVTSRAKLAYGPGGSTPTGETTSCACLEIGPLDLDAPFVALQWAGKTGLANSLYAMAELIDENDHSLAFTWGLAPVQPWGKRGFDWREIGIAYDSARSTGLPRGQLASLIRNRVELDEMPCLGFARGRNRYLVAPVEPSVPGVRGALAGMIDDALADGVDGIDFRFGSHTESLDFENYGFNPETCRRYEEKYGVSPVGAGFDLQKWQTLRGENVFHLLDSLCRQIHEKGAATALHIWHAYEIPASEPCYQGCYYPWREWVKTGMFDSLTAKHCHVHHPLSGEIIALGKECGLPVLANQKPKLGNDSECDDSWCILIDKAEAHGFTTFNFYECANMVRLMADGNLEKRCPKTWAKIASHSD